MDEGEFADQLNHSRLKKAYLRLAEEARKIKESPASYGIRGEPERPKRKPKKQEKEQVASSSDYSKQIDHHTAS